MKCPKCGTFIPDDAVYCPTCGEEIKIVPEFDPLIENRIDESLSNLASNLGDTGELSGKDSEYSFDSPFEDDDEDDDFDANEEGHIFGSSKVTICVLCIVLIALLSSVVYFLLNADLSNDDTKTADTVKSTSLETSSDAGSASSDSEELSDSREPKAPEFSVASGTYNEKIEVYISAGEGSIYYTTSGITPTQADSVYNGIDPIVFDENGTYTLMAILVDENGSKSEVTTATYEIALDSPSAPTIIEDSGSYNVDTQIAVVAAEGTNVYYTTDGSDPTASSTLYKGPISMPYGDSVFKFVAVDNLSGASSEIVERKYSLHYTVNVTKEQAASALVTKLVSLGYLLDENGLVAGMDGCNSYLYTSTEVISSGDYYVFTEYFISTDGTTTPTGLLYGVNTHDGTVYRLGTYGTGDYFLKQLS